MTPNEIASRHPRLFHITSMETVEGVSRHGLLSARDIVERCDADPELLGTRRADRVALTDQQGSRYILSDNIPLSETKLAKVLDDGLTPTDWLQMLAARVFFWTDRRHAEKLAGSRNNEGHPKALLVIDTLSLIATCHDRAEVSPINSGATIHQAARRGLDTFASLPGLDFAAWRRRRGNRTLDRIKEVTIRGSLPNVKDSVVEWAHG